MNKNLSRRGFSALITAGAAFAQQQTPPAGAPNPNTSAPPPPRGRPTVPEYDPFGQTIEFKRKDVAAKVQPFPMAQVRLLSGSFQDIAGWNRGYMQRLPVDRLAYNFRENARLPNTAKPFGGWEQAANGRRASELRGHFTGHFLSASALLYASTGDKEAKAKGDELVAELAKCQQKINAGGYLSAFPLEFFDRLDARKPVWAPFYTIHKIMAGMLDMHQLAGNQQALEVVQGMASWADQWTGSKTEEHMQDILNTEFGGMAESLYNLAAVTNNDQWAKVGDRYTKKRFFNPLARRSDQLRGLHVNTHIPQVIGAARRYEISGDRRFREVANFFFYEVSTARSYVTNGTSTGEDWESQPLSMGAERKLVVASAECCCAYNMLKLARHLYSWTGNPRYFDYYERTLLNHRMGTIQPQTGHTQYYLSMYPAAWKTFNTEDDSFWCCTGTGVEEYAKLNDSIYWRDEEGVYVNLFLPSELTWTEKGFRLRQDTKFPEQQSTALTITVDRPTQMAVRLRIPSWLSSAPALKLNGRALEASAAPGSYLVLNRSWRTGDKIEMALPMHLSVEAMPDEPQTQAFLYGPVVLAGDLGADGLNPDMITGPSAPPLRRAPATTIPALRAAGSAPGSWIKPADKPFTFHTAGQPKDVTLASLNSIFERRYNVYWEVT